VKKCAEHPNATTSNDKINSNCSINLYILKDCLSCLWQLTYDFNLCFRYLIGYYNSPINRGRSDVPTSQICCLTTITGFASRILFILWSPNAKIPINKIHKQSAVLDLFNHCDDQLLSQTKWSTAQVTQYVNKTEKQTAGVNLIYASKHVIMYFVCVDAGRKCYLILSRWSRFDFSQSIHAAMFCCGRVRCLVENANISRKKALWKRYVPIGRRSCCPLFERLSDVCSS